MRLQVFDGRVSSSRLIFRACFNTAFLSKGMLIMRADELDKVSSC